MKAPTSRLFAELQQMTDSLSFDDTLMAIECAEKIRNHLIASINNGHSEHQHNLSVVNEIIKGYKLHLFDSSPMLVA
ncbi:hypothetical protein [Marinoscillum sp. MHG1-6]|uniref:hypothetical protein n=1 Tax=Marinoscillum sp. MHG1-6 TaxID=2959627 RepID=UPI00215840C2|nr:hypothetical protein [Marinoscillum sp. MHG1-6]